MSRLSSVSLKRFRIFREESTFDFAPLTVITGPNSSGKSSVLKALLLLKASQTASQLSRLNFFIDRHWLPGFEAVRSHNSSGNIEFTIGIQRAFGSTLPERMSVYDPENPNYNKIKRSRPRDEASFDWPAEIFVTVEFDHGGFRELVIECQHDMRKHRVLSMTWWEHDKPAQPMEGFELPVYGSTVELNGHWLYEALGGSPEAIAETLSTNTSEDFVAFTELLNNDVQFYVEEIGSVAADRPSGVFDVMRLRNFDPLSGGTSISPDTPGSAYFHLFYEFTLVPLLERCMDALNETLSSIAYAGSFQKTSERIYQYGSSNQDLFDLIHNAYRSGSSLADTVEPWLSFFNIGDALRINQIPGVGYTIDISRDGFYVPVADIGSGHANLIPLILYIGLQKPSTILVEEPEANLHPNLQSRLADLFVELTGSAVNTDQTRKNTNKEPTQDESDWGGTFYSTVTKSVSNKRLIVETHSEYLLRRLQYLVASGKADPAQIVINYVGPNPDVEDYIRQIHIEPSGKLSQDVGPGFMDEATNLMVDLYNQAHQN